MNFEENTNLIINYLPQPLSDAEFRKIFEQIGPISQCKIIRNKNNYSYGFGFVEYVNKNDAEKAIHQLNGLQLMNKRIKVAWSRPCNEDIKKAKLYIKNVPPDISVEELNGVFKPYGTIIQSNIASNKNIAFILFDKREQAEKAIENLHNVTLAGSALPLDIKFASSNSIKFNNNNNNGNNYYNSANNHHNNNNQNNYNDFDDTYNGNNSFNSSNTRSNRSSYNNSNNYHQNSRQAYSGQSNERQSRNYQNYNNYDYGDSNYQSSSGSGNGNGYGSGNGNGHGNGNNDNYRYNASSDQNYGGPIRSSQVMGSKAYQSNRYNPMTNNSSYSSPSSSNYHHHHQSSHSQHQHEEQSYNDSYSTYDTHKSDRYSNNEYSNYNRNSHQDNNQYYHQNSHHNSNFSQNHSRNNYYQENDGDGDQSGYTIFVYNYTDTEEQLCNLFSKYGLVIKCNVLRKKGFAFVNMAHYEDAETAIAHLNNQTLNGNRIQVSFKK